MNNPTIEDDKVIRYSTVLDSEKNELLKIPVARIGKWFHPEYKTVEFTQEDLNDIRRNFNTAACGYEPPLFKGHPVTTDAVEKAPAEGWPAKLIQEDDVLYGLYTPTSEQVMDEVKCRKFRYSSPEIVRNAVNKSTNERIGTLLIANALTNRPFLPMQDLKIEVVDGEEYGIERFSDNNSDVIKFAFDILGEEMSDKAIETPEVTAPLATPSAEQFSDATDYKAKYEALAGNYSALNSRFESLAHDYAKMAQSVSDLTVKEQEREQSAKEREQKQYIDKVQKFAIPEADKVRLIGFIEAGTLTGEALQEVMSTKEQYSEALTTTLRHTQPAPEHKEVMETINPVHKRAIEASIRRRDELKLPKVYIK